MPADQKARTARAADRNAPGYRAPHDQGPTTQFLDY